MTPTDLDAVEALCAKATPGPWHRAPIYWTFRVVEKGNIDVLGDLPDDTLCPYMDDADFIAESRTLLPQLAAELRAARERIAELEVAAANVALCFNDWPKHNSPYAHNERLRALKSLIDAAAARGAQEG